MSRSGITPPSEFDLPPGRLLQRREHLVAELAGRKRRRGRRTVVLGLALFLLSGAAIAGTRPLWYDLVAPSEESFVEELRSTVDGETWILGRSENGRGDLCVEVIAPAGWQSAGCLPGELRLRRPIHVAGYGGAGATSVLMGFVSPAVERLVMIRVDCSYVELPVSESGLFFSVVGGALASPLRLEGFDLSGRPVASYVMGRGLVRGPPPPGDC